MRGHTRPAGVCDLPPAASRGKCVSDVGLRAALCGIGSSPGWHVWPDAEVPCVALASGGAGVKGGGSPAPAFAVERDGGQTLCAGFLRPDRIASECQSRGARGVVWPRGGGREPTSPHPARSGGRGSGVSPAGKAQPVHRPLRAGAIAHSGVSARASGQSPVRWHHAPACYAIHSAKSQHISIRYAGADARI